MARKESGGRALHEVIENVFLEGGANMIQAHSSFRSIEAVL